MVASPLEGTYLMWLDFRAVCDSSERLAEYLENEAGVKLSTGTIYGPVADGWERLNIACPRKVLLEGLERLARGVREFEKRNSQLADN